MIILRMLNALEQFNKRLLYKPESPEMKLYPKLHFRVMAATIDSFVIFFILLIFTPLAPELPQEIAILQNQLIEKQITDQEWIHGITHYFLSPAGMSMFLTNIFIQIFIVMLFSLIFWFWCSATPGKLLFGIRIVDENTLEKPTYKKFIVRCFSYLISAIPFGIGYLWIWKSKKRQAWHDSISGTLVIYKRHKPENSVGE